MKNNNRLSCIVFIAGSYPQPWQPYRGVFFRELVQAFVRQGIQCITIHPLQVDRWLRHIAFHGKSNLKIEPNDVIRPIFLSLSNRNFGLFNTYRLTQAMFQQATMRALRRIASTPDAVIGHFLYTGGATAAWLGKRIERPSFVSVGEGTFRSLKRIGLERARRDFRDITGVIAVSTLLKKKLISEIGIPAERIGVFPNGVELTRFFARPRHEMREKYGFPKNEFLTVFVGNYLRNKGVARLAAAIDGLDGVFGLFAGTGPLIPKGRNVINCGQVHHENIPEILSAGDVFVLPTLVEGSCNAIIEAMACGLPIISANGEFNNNILDDSMSIRTDPMDVLAIRQAIVALRDDPERRGQMARAALIRSKRFDLDLRATRILSFMVERIQAKE